MPAIIDGKPVFEPPMTREIFWTKWSSHVESTFGHLMRYLSKARSEGNRAGIVSSVEIYKKCLNDIKIFEAEAEELGYKEEPLRSELAKALAADLTAHENPFRDIEMMLAMIERFITYAKMSKEGKRVHYWPIWQTLPLETRKAINDLIEDFAKEKEQGRCVVSKEIGNKFAELAQQLSETE